MNAGQMRRRCQVAVGTPGRVCKLLEMGALVVRNCRTLVLDEADHLLSDSFVKDIRSGVCKRPTHQTHTCLVSHILLCGTPGVGWVWWDAFVLVCC